MVPTYLLGRDCFERLPEADQPLDQPIGNPLFEQNAFEPQGSGFPILLSIRLMGKYHFYFGLFRQTAVVNVISSA